MSVPLLDLQGQYRPLRDELLATMTRVCDSQRFIGGPEVDGLPVALRRFEMEVVRPDVDRDPLALDPFSEELVIDQHPDVGALLAGRTPHVENDGGSAFIELADPLRAVAR